MPEVTWSEILNKVSCLCQSVENADWDLINESLPQLEIEIHEFFENVLPGLEVDDQKRIKIEGVKLMESLSTINSKALAAKKAHIGKIQTMANARKGISAYKKT